MEGEDGEEKYDCEDLLDGRTSGVGVNFDVGTGFRRAFGPGHY